MSSTNSLSLCQYVSVNPVRKSSLPTGRQVLSNGVKPKSQNFLVDLKQKNGHIILKGLFMGDKDPVRESIENEPKTKIYESFDS
jgi:hypothetical protein